MAEIKSYRDVFRLERRIYRIDRLRLNPTGVPVRGLAYFLALVSGALLLGRLPLLGPIAAILPWYLRDLAAPLLLAAATAVVRIDGRPGHLALWALLRFVCSPRRLVALRAAPSMTRWAPPALLVLPDGSEARMRRLRYMGPGTVRVAAAHVRREHPRAQGGRGRIVLGPLPGARRPARAQLLLLRGATRVEVGR